MNRMLAKTAVAAVAVVASVTSPGPAGAATGSPATSAAAALEWCPGTASLCQDAHAVEKLAKGTRLKLNCTTSGRGGTWFYVRVPDGKTGFVPAARVKRAQSVPTCSHNRAVTAAIAVTAPDLWHQKHPTAAMKAHLKRVYGADAFENDNDWSGDSGSLGSLAYLANGDKYKIEAGNPIDTYGVYKSRGKVHNGGTPPIGALVYWHNVSAYDYEYGLLGISLGNRQAITVPGFDVDEKPIGLKSTKGNLGWVLPY